MILHTLQRNIKKKKNRLHEKVVQAFEQLAITARLNSP